MRCSQRMILKLSVGCLVIPFSFPRLHDQDPEMLPSSFDSSFHRELESVLWNWDRWQSWLSRQMIWDFWCKNHLPFRIPPLLSSTWRFYLPSSHPYFSTKLQPHSYDIRTYLFSLETRWKSPNYPCWCDPAFTYLLAALGLRCFVRVFSSSVSRDYLHCGAWAPCRGFFFCGAQALGDQASVVAAHRPSNCGTQA